jgi:hypothetical protein
MEIGNPFLSSVCRTPWDVDHSVDGLNAEILDQLVEGVGVKSGGPLVLLTAPRAGYGKTHLLGRVAAATAHQAVMVPLAFRAGDSLHLTTLSRRGIESLHQAASDLDGWSKLRESSAHLITILMRRLIASGQLSCANPTQALGVLAGPVQDIFNAQGKARMIGDWIGKNRESLHGALAMLAARELPIGTNTLDSWLSALLEQVLEGGQTGIADMQALCAGDKESGIPTWLRLLSLWRPVVLLVDHLDGFYRNPQAGVEIATLLMDLVDVHQVHVLLSLNQDVWQATFGHHLPSALEDRLTSSQVLLRGLTEEDAESLLHLRLERSGVTPSQQAEFSSFVSVNRHFLGRPIGSISARAFLRHCARQWEIFQSAPPSPQESDSDVLPAVSTSHESDAESGLIPLKTETLVEPLPSLHLASNVPSLFDKDTLNEVQLMAESLAEPRPALPQDEHEHIENTSASWPHPDSEPSASGEDTLLDDEVGSDEWKSTPGVTTRVPSGAAPSADAFVKLREMLARLRKPGSTIPSADSPFKLATASATAVSEPSISVDEKPIAQPTPAKEIKTPDILQLRFQSLRQQLNSEVGTQPLDHAKIAELIRLAGRRFPLVRFSEHELPGLTGRYVMYWALQGVEILFGLASFTDAAYWRTLSGFAAGRLTDLAAQAEREGTPPPKLKLVTFKSEREQLIWQNLLNSKTIAEPLEEITDAVHLDTDNIAILYAMQRIIKEAEAGTLPAEPTQVMTVLARELDFFWKRITRVS